MRILFLNPPHKKCISRRYRCSYNSPRNLLPPQDLLQLAACAKEWNKVQVTVFDAIALKKTEDQVFTHIENVDPDFLIAVVGVDIFGDDITFLERLKNRFPSLPCGIFGYYPTVYSAEILANSTIDFILRGEPEQPLTDYIHACQQGINKEAICGFAGRKSDGTPFVNPWQRLTNLDKLPFADYTLVNLDHYDEAFLGNRCAAILASRGCPFSCHYCVPTYDHYVIFKSPEIIVEEMKHLVRVGALSIRFLDDTFTYRKQWVIDLCEEIVRQEVNIPWSCLSRVDTLDEELLSWMRKAGCVRILVGIESYSQRVLDCMNKGIDASIINFKLELIKKYGIQPVGFFVVGAPFEEENDFKKTVRGALDSPLDLILVTMMTPYGGTPFVEQYKDEIEFNLFPYKCAYRNPQLEREARRRYRQLYMRFYMRPNVVVRNFSFVFRHPFHTLHTLRALLVG